MWSPPPTTIGSAIVVRLDVVGFCLAVLDLQPGRGQASVLSGTSDKFHFFLFASGAVVVEGTVGGLHTPLSIVLANNCMTLRQCRCRSNGDERE